MTAKEYLRQLRDLDRILTAKSMEYQNLQTMATKVNTPLGENKVQTSPDKSKNEDLIIKMAELRDEIQMDIDKYRELLGKINKQIEELDDIRYRTVLFMRYVNSMSFREIAEVMNYHEISVIKLHRKALQEFNEKYKVASFG